MKNFAKQWMAIAAMMCVTTLVTQNAGAQCYIDANGNQVCRSSGFAKSTGPIRRVFQAVTPSRVTQQTQYPSVGSSVTYGEVSYSTVYSTPVYSSGYGSTGSSAITVSGGSSGSAAAAASSVPTLAPDVNQSSVLARKSDFRKALMQAAKAAKEKGEITTAQYFKIAAMSRVPKVLANLEASMHEAAIEEGLATTQAVDWDAIIEFIEKLIPLIIQLIDLFSSNLPPTADLTLEQAYAFCPPTEFTLHCVA